MRVWYTSDLHLQHRFVANLRGFGDDVVAHDCAIREAWSVVRADDVVYVLGDVALGRLQSAIDFLSDLPGRKRLVAGNHDRCHPMYRDAHKHARLFGGAFEEITPFARRRIAGESVLLSHFPYSADHTAIPRYAQYRLPDRGMWLLHGHTHTDVIRTGPREIHVGWDAWQRLVTEDEIAALIEATP